MPGIARTGFDSRCHRLVQIRIGQDNKRIRAAQFQHGAFDNRTGGCRDFGAAPGRSGKGNRSHPRVGDDFFHTVSFDRQADHDVRQFQLPDDFAESRLQLGCATGHVGVVFHDAGIARHQRRGHETQSQPDRHIPGQYPQHWPQRLVAHPTAAGVRLNHLLLQIRFGTVGKMLRTPGGFFNFSATVPDGLAHFFRHQQRQLILAVAQLRCQCTQRFRALGERPGAPVHVSLADRRQPVFDIRIRNGIMFPRHHPCGGIGRSQHVGYLTLNISDIKYRMPAAEIVPVSAAGIRISYQYGIGDLMYSSRQEPASKRRQGIIEL